MIKNKCEWFGPTNSGCDRTAIPNTAYCEQHLHRVYQQGSALRRRASDQRLASWLSGLETTELDAETQDD
jgi:hypothetical protein